MKIKELILISSVLISSVTINAQDVIIKDPGYFKESIRDGHPLFPDSLIYSSDAEEIIIPDVSVFGRLRDYKFPKLKKVTFGNIDYIPGGVCSDMPMLEEIIFDGRIGHFDCTLVSNCPRLRKIFFRGPISTTGGPGFLYNLPKLDSLIFESVVVDFGCDFGARHECPNLKGIINKGAFIKVYNENFTPKATIEQIRSNPKFIKDLERIAEWQSEILTAKNPEWLRNFEYQAARVLLPILQQIDSNKAPILKKAMDYAWGLGDEVKTELDILKESKSYASDSTRHETFSYALPSDSLLTATRTRFNLDSIAGSGNDISKIKNLLYWIHNNITHDGSGGFPKGALNLANIYDSSRRDSCGYNCRTLAIGLSEALLAEGIPARYVTCESKSWDTDIDCHVICVAWSDSLDKWVWVDPTFAAFVTDENGLMLHPGEVRYRLQHDLPIVLNEDANWNNQSKQTKEHYIDSYMAKNLYILSSNMINQSEPEGQTIHPIGKIAALVPLDSNYTNAHIITSDEKWFWQKPIKYY